MAVQSNCKKENGLTSSQYDAFDVIGTYVDGRNVLAFMKVKPFTSDIDIFKFFVGIKVAVLIGSFGGVFPLHLMKNGIIQDGIEDRFIDRREKGFAGTDKTSVGK